ncbi:MAG: hypothetical protein ACLQVJ_26280 [Syntrophobacteraceae bacterium]
MENERLKNEIGNLTLTIAPDALRSIISGGRLLEFVDTVAKEAAAQICAQIVNQVALEALKTEGISSDVAARVSFIFEDGGYGTRPRPPHWGVFRIDEVAASPLQRLASRIATSGD